MKRRLLQCFLIACLYAHTAFGEAELLTIDDAIEESMKYLSGKMAPESKTVILNIESESKKLSNYIINKSNVFIMNNTNLSLIDKSRLSGVLKKKDINDLSEINESAAEIGKELGAESVIFGSISKAGKYYSFSIQAVDVSNWKILGMRSLNVIEDDLLADLAHSPSAQTSASINSQNASNQNPNVQVVVVRDTPASSAQSDATTTTTSSANIDSEKKNRVFLANRWQFALCDYYGDNKVGMGYELEIGKYRDLILTTTILSINFPPVVGGGGSNPSGDNNYLGGDYGYDDNGGLFDGKSESGLGLGGGAFIAAIISVSDYLKVIPGMDIGFWFYRAYGYNQMLFGGPDVRVMFGYQFVFLDVMTKVHLGPSIADEQIAGASNSTRRFGAKFQWGVGITFLLGGN